VEISEDALPDDRPLSAEFTYSVKWRKSDVPYDKRMDKYRRYQFLPQHLEVRRDRVCACDVVSGGLQITLRQHMDRLRLRSGFVSYDRCMDNCRRY
jgi:hypothetical protein